MKNNFVIYIRLQKKFGTSYDSNIITLNYITIIMHRSSQFIYLTLPSDDDNKLIDDKIFQKVLKLLMESMDE